MMDGYDSYRYAFESCKTYRDGSVDPSDFANICRRYRLNYKQVMDHMGGDGKGRFSLDTFIHYLKRCQHSQAQHSHHQTNYYDQESYTRPTSPVHRPSSAGKHTRQAVHSSASSGYHHSRMSTRYPVSPVTGVYNEQDTFTPDDHHLNKRRQEMTRTPDYYLSPEDKATMPRTGHDRDRLRAAPPEPDHYIHEHRSATSRSRVGAVSRATNERAIDSPPPISRRNLYSGRSDKARSFRDEDSDVDDNPESFYPPPHHSTRSSCKKCKSHARQLSELLDDLKASRSERERLEQSLDAVRKDLRVAQNSDVAYAQIYRENERLKHEVKKLKKDSSIDPDSERAYFDRQYEEMKKIKEDLEEELNRERSAHRHYKRECAALKDEYNNLRLKNEELQRNNWKLTDENQRLSVRLMDDDRSSLVSRRPGDGGSEEHSARSSLAGEPAFLRQSTVRQTYHGPEGRQPVRDGSRPRKSRLEMKRTSSEGKALDEHPTKDETNHTHTHKAKSHVSAASDAGSMAEGFGLSMVSTTPDEQSQVFMVLGEAVSKSVLPEGLPKEKELAMIYALQNCHSIQELIKCLVSYGVSTTSDKLQGFQIENEHLKKVVDHLKSKHATLAHSFESSKANMDSMYHTALKVEANNTRMKLIIKLCQQACEVYEVLLDLRTSESRNGSTSTAYFPSFDYSDSIDATSTRSPDREAMMIKHSPAYRARSLLHSLEGNPELQHYLPPVHKSRQNSSDYHASHWHPGTLSQNTGTTSGLSSLSGGMEVEISQAEIDRLRLYTQALRQYENHLIATLTSMEGVKGIELVKKNEIIKDSNLLEQGRVDITELEDAAHAEELCKVREEKAELRSQIYMMEQEKRRMELEVGRMIIHQKKTERQIFELQFKLSEERRKRKRERKGRKGEASVPHEANIMSELSIDYAGALEREKELSRRYDELFAFMQSHVKESQSTTDDLMRFVKELRQANSALVDAFEKSKKRQQAEKRRMKQDLVSYMNRVQNSTILDATVPTAPVT